MALHLDSEYRGRYEEYIMQDGTVYNSREINWRDISNWYEVVKIIVHLKEKVWEIDCTNEEGFMGYVRLRNGGQLAQFNAQGQPMAPKVIHEWCFGWTDGVKVYLKVVDFKTGEELPSEIRNYDDTINHIHPSLK